MKENPIITFCGSRKYDSILQYVSSKLKHDGYDVLMPKLKIDSDGITSLTMKGILESNYSRLSKSAIIITIIPTGFMSSLELGYVYGMKDKYLIGIHDISRSIVMNDIYKSTLYAIFDSIETIDLSNKSARREVYDIIKDKLNKVIK